jgi:hypothetical protein
MSMTTCGEGSTEALLRAEVARLRQHLGEAIEMLQIMHDELQAAHEQLMRRPKLGERGRLGGASAKPPEG